MEVTMKVVRYFTLSTIFGTLISVIIICLQLSDKINLGNNLWIALLSIFYAVLFQFIIVVSMRAMIQKNAVKL